MNTFSHMCRHEQRKHSVHNSVDNKVNKNAFTGRNLNKSTALVVMLV